MFGLTEIYELLLLYTPDAELTNHTKMKTFQIQTLQTGHDTNLQQKHRNVYDKVLTGQKK